MADDERYCSGGCIYLTPLLSLKTKVVAQGSVLQTELSGGAVRY